MKNDMPIMEFAKRFVTGRLNWYNTPRLGLTNFGNIISLVLYRNDPFQVELFIAPTASSFTTHRHPNVDTVEFGVAGSFQLFINGKEGHTEEQSQQWLNGEFITPLIAIKPTDWHSGVNTMPYAFLSIQKWLNGVTPTSVGLNWIGEPSSPEQQEMWKINEPNEALQALVGSHRGDYSLRV